MKRILVGQVESTFRATLAISVVLSATGCAYSPSWLSSSGPTRAQVVEQNAAPLPIPVLELDGTIVQRMTSVENRTRFSDVFGEEGKAYGHVIGPGDVIEVSIWEAPPAILFGAAGFDPGTGVATTRMTSFPQQMVPVDGVINVPFAGAIRVAGKSAQQVEDDIARKLVGKANQPQVTVRVTRNATSYVTVVGEVGQSVRMPLTAQGERLLDALAASGGVRQPVGKMSIQLSRGGVVHAMPLDEIIRDPKQNVLLQPGDVVTALFQPNSLTALGASGKNEEIAFEAQGISLAQALGRMGGLQDARADAKGVFIFRFENPAAFPENANRMPRTADGKVPVVYRVDLKDPRAFLLAQNFPMKNKDVVYVANAPSAELQKFLNILSATFFTASSLVNLSN